MDLAKQLIELLEGTPGETRLTVVVDRDPSLKSRFFFEIDFVKKVKNLEV